MVHFQRQALSFDLYILLCLKAQEILPLKTAFFHYSRPITTNFYRTSKTDPFKTSASEGSLSSFFFPGTARGYRAADRTTVTVNMPGDSGRLEPGNQYSPLTGLVYIFNLIVGTGALTLPAAFHEAG